MGKWSAAGDKRTRMPAAPRSLACVDLGWPKIWFGVFHLTAPGGLVVFNFIGNYFVTLYCDSCHISVH